MSTLAQIKLQEAHTALKSAHAALVGACEHFSGHPAFRGNIQAARDMTGCTVELVGWLHEFLEVK